ncbi:SanA/YdcF family protein [Flavilitoribacter nigricans]|nr:ElyC/SanA/YdcF family protein [Flavilitoribacter nigricans]
MKIAPLRKVGIWLIISFLCVIAGIFICNLWVKSRAKAHIFDAPDQLPPNDIALVLGTASVLADGRPNLYFETRMDAAAALYKSGKVKHLLLSGDNSREAYNEPAAMQEALEKRGVPASAITLDYAGFRTLDSVVRCREVFQREQFTVVSQPFHNERAVFIARAFGMKAVAFNADSIENFDQSWLLGREYLARVKAVLDVYFLRKQPKYLGDKIDIEI